MGQPTRRDTRCGFFQLTCRLGRLLIHTASQAVGFFEVTQIREALREPLYELLAFLDFTQEKTGGV